MVKHLVALSTALMSALHVSAVAAASGSDNLFITGVQASSQSSYAYAGVLRAAKNSSIGDGLYYKAVASYLTYTYDTTLNNLAVRNTGTAPGIDIGAGYASHGEGYTADISASVGYRHLHLSPVIPANERVGGRVSFTPQFQGSLTLAKNVEARTLISYTFGQQSSFDRAQLIAKFPNNWFGGLEDSYQEGKKYQINQIGFVAGKNLTNGYALSLSAGRSRQRGSGSSNYAGVSLSRLF